MNPDHPLFLQRCIELRVNTKTCLSSKSSSSRSSTSTHLQFTSLSSKAGEQQPIREGHTGEANLIREPIRAGDRGGANKSRQWRRTQTEQTIEEELIKAGNRSGQPTRAGVRAISSFVGALSKCYLRLPSLVFSFILHEQNKLQIKLNILG